MSFFKEIKDIEVDKTIITATQRLSARICQQHDAEQVLKGLQTWPSLKIWALQSWLEHSYQTLLTQCSHPNLPLLLTTEQEKRLWETCIRNSPQGQSLLYLDTTANLAMQAWETICAWECFEQLHNSAFTEDTQAFLDWAKEIRALCAEKQWLTQAELGTWVKPFFEQGLLEQPTSLLLIGFDELTPQMRSLFKTLESFGTNIETSVNAEQTANIHVLAAADTKAEIKTMANWAKQETELNPNISIGCIVPELNSLRDDIEHIFTEAFCPEQLLPYADTLSKPFNISAGKRFSDFPLIHCAVQLLSISWEIIPLETLSFLLRNPFLKGYEQEASKRAEFDAYLRFLGVSNLSLSQCLLILEKNPNLFCPELHKNLSAFVQVLHSNSSLKLSVAQWASTFHEELLTLGWPGDRIFDSTEYQVFTRWLEMLSQYSCLELVCSQLSRSQALKQIKQFTSDIIFQAQTTPKQIQILGLLESSSLPFDKIWVMGLSDARWPAAAKPNPFIPYTLQRALNMPHSSAKREFQFSQQIMQRLLSSAQEIIFSYPLQEDGHECYPSPLLTAFDIPWGGNKEPLTHPAYLTNMQKNQNLESFTDDFGPMIEAEEKIRGGTGIIKTQAACPFQAFATLRLGAKPFSLSYLGLNALERGSILHDVLEKIWQRLKNHETLSNITHAELQKLVSAIVHASLRAMNEKRLVPLAKTFCRLEQKRLMNIVLKWLAYEKTRDIFEVVATEQRQTISLNSLTLHIQMDRIDKLCDGSLAIIDYKTGKPSVIDWFGNRPDEPQLPLYLITSEIPISTLTFAEIRSDNTQFRGISANEESLPDVIPFSALKIDTAAATWEEQKSCWRTNLENLAEEFLTGVATVTPKDGAATCQYCQLQGVCRVQEK